MHAIEAGSKWYCLNTSKEVVVWKIERDTAVGDAVIKFKVAMHDFNLTGSLHETHFLERFDPDVPLTREWLIENGLGVSYDGQGDEVYGFDNQEDLIAYWHDGQWFWEFNGMAVWKGKALHAQTTGAAFRMLHVLGYVNGSVSPAENATN
jgi:hypothetical protein